MVEKDLFAVQRLSIESKSKLRDISQYLKPHFAVTVWDQETERLLRDKVQYKIKRIRATLLSQRKIVRGRHGFTMSEDTEEETGGVNIQTLIDTICTLSSTDRGVLFNRILEDGNAEVVGQVAQALARSLSLRHDTH